MSISVKISQLNEGGLVSSTDQIPVARGASETVRIPASQFVVNGTNIGVGTGQLYFDRSTGPGTTLQFRSLSGTDGIAVSNQGNTLVISASGQNPTRNAIVGNGTSRIFTITGATSINPSNYRVDIDGVLQEPIADYSIVGSTIVFVDPPPNGSKVTVVSNNLVRVFDVIPSDGSVTPQKLSLGSLTWNTSGNVGIGTSATGYKLHVREDISNSATWVASTNFDNTSISSGAGFLAVANGTNNYSYLLQYQEGSTYIAKQGSSGAFNFLTSSTSPMVFWTNNTERMRITSTGNVGIGTTNPQQALHVQGNVRVGDATLTQPLGDAPMFACRAWVNFDGTRNTAGTVTTTGDRFIRASGNVSRVARVDFGRYTVFFTTPMLDTNYCVNGSAADTRYSNNAVTIGDSGLNPLYQTGSFNICITNTTSYDDRQHVNVTVFR